MRKTLMGVRVLKAKVLFALIFLLARPSAMREGNSRQSNTHSAEISDFRTDAHRLWEENRDSAHAALWRQFGGTRIVAEDVAVSMGEPPGELTVFANGRELKLDAAHRDGKVNSNMLTVSARCAQFLQDPNPSLNISLSVSSFHRYGAFAEGKTTNVGCEVTKLEDGILVHFGPNPDHQQMMLTVRYGSQEHTWQITTSDQSSGDAQAQIMFRHDDFDGRALKKKHGDQARHHMGSESNFLIAKELTIFDLDSRPDTPALETNGFEVDSSGSLKASMADFMDEILHDEDPHRRFILDFEITSIREVYLSTRDELKRLGEAIEPDGSRWNLTKDVQVESETLSRGVVIAQFEHKCSTTLNKYLNCDLKPDGFSTDLVPPVKLKIVQSTQKKKMQTTRAFLMLVGAEIALAPPDMRKDVLKRFLPQGMPLDSSIFQVGGNVNEVVNIIENAADKAEKLLEAMETKSVDWWKAKTQTTADIKSACFSMLFRHTRAGMQGLPIAHVDATSVDQWFREGGAYPAVSQHRTEQKLGMKLAEALTHVVATINEWVNADEKPIAELPLAMMDTKTLNTQDLDLHWLQAHHLLESMALRWSDTQKWWYKNLKQAEGYIFATSPHEGPDSMHFTGTPHSAFKLKRGVHSVIPLRGRQSVEFRCLLVDKSWDNPKATTTAKGTVSVPKVPPPAIRTQLGRHIMSLMVAGDQDSPLFEDSDLDE